MKKVVIKNGKVESATGEIKLLKVIADLGENKTEENNKNITKTDSKTNIKLEATTSVIPNDTTMSIAEITSGETFNQVKNNLTGIKNFKAFNITLKSNNKNIQPNGKVKISIPIPERFDISKLIIYRIEDDGAKTTYQSKVENGYATFETDHFSTYVLAETSSNETKDNTNNNTGKNDTKLPQTGEENNAFVGWLSITIFLGTFWLGSMLLIDREKKKITKK